jgi:hypothetical protein
MLTALRSSVKEVPAKFVFSRLGLYFCNMDALASGCRHHPVVIWQTRVTLGESKFDGHKKMWH